jgi:DNA-binding XRE family transcriptional regulator
VSRKPKSEEASIRNRIEELRTELGLSRQDLADALGVHYQTIGYIERGEYSPSLLLALKISQQLRQSVDDIFTLEDLEDGK